MRESSFEKVFMLIVRYVARLPSFMLSKQLCSSRALDTNLQNKDLYSSSSRAFQISAIATKV